LNRHYVAEGVRVYSQESWKQVVGPQGGARLLVKHLDQVVAAFCEAVRQPNHAVREAGCKCIEEVITRVAAPQSPFHDQFGAENLKKLLGALLEAFDDESWPVRDYASLALGSFVEDFPEVCASEKESLMRHWLEQLCDNVPSLRSNGAMAFTKAVKVYVDWWPHVADHLRKALGEVKNQPEVSKTFANYTPSGPFSVPVRNGEQWNVPEPINQTMYSCGSLAPKTHKKKHGPSGGCMNCNVDRPQQPWEACEGAIRLLTEIAPWALLEHRAEVVEMMPLVRAAFDVDHFPHHTNLKQSICECLPRLQDGLQGDFSADMFVPALEQCVSGSHRNLAIVAGDALQALRAGGPPAA